MHFNILSTMMQHVFYNRQCSAYQVLEAHEYPLAVSHTSTPPALPLVSFQNANAAVLKPKLVEEDSRIDHIWQPIIKASSVLVATVATYIIHNFSTGINPVQASGIVSIAATLLLPEYAALAGMCGSFAGMVSTAVVPTIWMVCLLGIVCAGMLSLFDRKDWFVGYGGRLGFISQVACTVLFLVSEFAIWVFHAETPGHSQLVDLSLYRLNSEELKSQLPVAIVFTVLGAIFMRLYKYTTVQFPNRISNSVAAVGMTGLLGGFLPPTMCGAAYCGAFVAMSAAPSILPSMYALFIASILAGMSQLALAGLLNDGWGGKLGTASFLGVVVYRWLAKAMKAIETIAEKSNAMKFVEQRIQSARTVRTLRVLPQ